MTSPSFVRMQRILIGFGLAVIIFGFGFIAAHFISPQRNLSFAAMSESQRTIIFGIFFGTLLIGSILMIAGLSAGLVREARFRDRCPCCRHRIRPEYERCPECATSLGVDPMAHFVTLSRVDRNEIGNCRRCGGMIRPSRVISRDTKAVPGQVICRDCGNVLISDIQEEMDLHGVSAQ